MISALLASVYVGEITALAVEVEAVAEDEFRRDGESGVVGLEAGARALWLIEEGGELERGRFLRTQVSQHLLGRKACVYDVLHYHHVASLDVLTQTHDLLDAAGGGRAALIARITHELHQIFIDAHAAEQVGGKDIGTREHHYKDRVLSLEVATYFGSHASHLGVNLLPAQIGLKA